MLINKDTPDIAQYLIYDCAGHVLPYVISFDTETKEIEMAIRVPSKKDEEQAALVEEKAQETEEDLNTQFLMQEGVDEKGEPTVNVVVIKFTLIGSYALKDGKPIH